MLTVKTGDRYPTYWTTSMDLTGATVRLIAKRDRDVAVVLPSTIYDATGGVVEHVLTGDLLIGTYIVELEITIGTQIITAPSSTFENLRVVGDLD